MNDKTLSKNNKTGYTGVCFESRAKKYRAYIFVDGEQKRLGYFSNIDDAINARKKAEELYKGYKLSYSPTDKFPLPRYVLKKIRATFPDTDLDFQLSTSILFYAAKNYDANTDLPHFYYRLVLSLLDHNGNVNMTPSDKQTLIKSYNLSLFILPDEEKVMLLKWINGFSIRKIAKEHNWSVSTTKRILDKTRKLAITSQNGFTLNSREDALNFEKGMDVEEMDAKNAENKGEMLG